MNRLDKAWTPPLIGLLLALTVAFVYWPVHTYGFIHCDDPEYVSQNPQVQAGLTWAGLAWAFTTTAAGNWHPVTWLSHMLDCQLFGLNPGAHHLVNVGFHLLNTILLFLMLLRLTGALWPSALAAALFGLHPLHVESVAWISERKDVLSTLFFLLTIGAYRAYAVSPIKDAGLSKEPRASHSTLHAPLYYVLSLALFALGLMSKPMLVSVPFVLLLLDYWPLRRLQITDLNPRAMTQATWGQIKPLLLEKIPFVVLAAGAGVATLVAQQQAGAVVSIGNIPMALRVENACVSCILYLGKMLWPARLSIFYPYPAEIPLWLLALAATLLLAGSVLAFVSVPKRPYIALGWLWYLVTLGPVIGLVQVGDQPMADRYTYIPLIGIFISLAWALGEVAAIHPLWRLPTRAGAAVWVGVCLALATLQVRFWRDSETLFQHALAVTDRNALAHMNLGAALVEHGKLDEARKHFEAALRIRPGYAQARSNVGFVLAAQGQSAQAIQLYRSALAINPRLGRTHFLLALALTAQNQIPEARGEYERSLQLDPNNPLALNNLAWILSTANERSLRDGLRAVVLAERGCKLSQFSQPQFIGTLAAAYAEAGHFDEAIRSAAKARDLALAQGQTELAKRNRELLELYRAGRPYREERPISNQKVHPAAPGTGGLHQP